MRQIRFLTAALVLLAFSCIKENPSGDKPTPEGSQITIRVSMPDQPLSKVAFTPDENNLRLAWQSTDCIRVICDDKSEVFTVSKLISNHEAEFTGKALSGSSFTILCPGTYASVEEAEADGASPAQAANGSTAHLAYRALLSGVDSYENVEFKANWAQTHGGSLKLGAAVKLQATLPAGAGALKELGFRLRDKDYTLPLEDVDVSAQENVLTAYMMLPWENIPLPHGTQVPVYVTDADDEVYSASLTVSGDKIVQQGSLNTFLHVNLALQPFAGGDGSAENPYLIANARQLNNMHNSGVLVGGQTKYFRLLKDVNASTITNWAPLNTAGTFDKGIDFDGAGFTISGLKSSGTTYASFAGVLYGNIHDVTFSGATINATSKCGVVAGFLGTTTNDYARVATCSGVTVTDCSVTGTSFAAGFAGQTRGKGAVTGCKVINTTVNGTNYLGGFTAQADISGVDKYEVPVIFTNCEVDGVVLNQNQASASSSLYTGGFIGYTYQAVSFVGCKVKGCTITANKAAVDNIGGFVGKTDYAGANFHHCDVDAATTITALGSNVGGFVGFAYVPDSYNTCTSAAKVTVSGSAKPLHTGGFAGHAAGAATFTDCTASGDVTSSWVYTGGFAGYAENASFTKCHYSGGTVSCSASGNNAQVGGFVGGVTHGVSLISCEVGGARVTAPSAGRTGGFAGQLGNSITESNQLTVSQCAVKNTAVEGAVNTGGFVGVLYESLSGCWVEGGSVTARAAQCGGFAAFIQKSDVSHCYSTAAVEGGSWADVGGFAGLAWQGSLQYCYSAGAQNGSGTNRAAFLSRCAQQGTNPVASVSSCIGWHASLPFCGSNTVGATFTDCYAGTEGSVSTRAQEQTWPASVWNLDGSMPVLLAVPSRIRAIFVGDSITWQWARNEGAYSKSNYPLKIPFNPAYMTDDGTNIHVKFHPGFFSGNGFIDKGISGQNTTQMLARFQRDVVDLNPMAVVIMGGTNDLAQGFAKEQTLANLSAMAEMADAAGIRVVLCSITPNNDSYSKLSNPKTKGAHIITLNGMIQDYVTTKGFAYCNYWDSLVAEDGLSLNEAYRLYDNLHPGPDGYDVMEPIILSVLSGIIN